MAAIDTLNLNITALTTATTALTTAVATIPTAPGVPSATEAQIQSAADAVAAQTAIVNTAVFGIQAAVLPPVA